MGVLAVTLAVFWRALSGEPVYDDLLMVGRNPWIRDLARLPDLLTRGYWDFLEPEKAQDIGYWRPLTALALSVGYRLADGAPIGFHALGLTAHLVATACAFALARRFLSGALAPGLVALVFGLHPMHVESVAWITALNDPLFGALGLAALLLFLRWRERGSRGLPLGAAAAFATALLAKELAVTILPMALVLDVLRPREPRPGEALPGPFAAPPEPGRAYGPFATVLVLYFLARCLVFRSALGGLDRITTDFGASAARLALLRVELLGGALELSFLPLRPSLFRPFRPDLALGDPAALRALAWIAGAAVLGAWLARKRLRTELAGLLLVPAGVLPLFLRVQSLGSFPLSDRFLYLPVLGAALLVVGGLPRLVGRHAGLGLVAFAALGLGARSHARIGVWHDELALFRASAADSPRSPYVLWGLGRVLLQRYNESGDPALLMEALATYHRAQDLLVESRKPDTDLFVSSRDFLQVNLGYAWSELLLARAEGGDPSTATALFEELAQRIEELRAQRERAEAHGIRVLSDHLELEQVYTGLGVARMQGGDEAGAEEALERAVELDPSYPEARTNLGRLRVAQGRWDEAIDAFRAALQHEPDDPETRLMLAQALQSSGRQSAAEDLARELVDEGVGVARACTVIAAVRLARREAREAVTWLNRALQADPSYGQAWYLLAEAKRLSADGEGALAAYLEAVRLLPASFEAHYNLGAFLDASSAPDQAAPYLVRAYALCPDADACERLAAFLREHPPRSPLRLLELAHADRGRGRADDAEAWIARALAAGVGAIDPGPERGSELLAAAGLLRDLGRSEEAVAWLRAACAELPESFGAHAELGCLLDDLGRHAEARPWLERARELPSPAGWDPGLVRAARQDLEQRLAQGGEGGG